MIESSRVAVVEPELFLRFNFNKVLTDFCLKFLLECFSLAKCCKMNKNFLHLCPDSRPCFGGEVSLLG